MIAAILDYCAVKFELERSNLNFVLVNGGYYRNSKRFRNTALIFNKAKPCLVARWYNEQSDLLVSESKALSYYNQVQIPAPKFIELTTIKNVQVLIEQHLAGQTLEYLLNCGYLDKQQALDVANGAFKDLVEKTSQESTKNDFIVELDRLFALNKNQDVFERHNINLAQTKELIVAAYKLNNYQTVFCHNDFICRNILLADKQSYLFDFEFAKRSHFYTNDWFRFLMHAEALLEPGEYLPEIINDKLLATSTPSLIKSMLLDPATIRALKILAYLADFKLRSTVYDEIYTNQLQALFDSQIGENYLPHLAVEPSSTTEQVKQIQHELIQREQLLSEIINSPSFRIGKQITTVIKLIPGFNKLYAKEKSS